MRILIAVFALIGLAVGTHAEPIAKTTPSGIVSDARAWKAKFPFDLYTIPAPGNRTLDNFVAVSYLVHFDATLYSLQMVKFIINVEVGGKIPSNADATFNELLSNWEHMIEDAYHFNYETLNQLYSELGHSNNTAEMRFFKSNYLEKNDCINEINDTWGSWRKRLVNELYTARDVVLSRIIKEDIFGILRLLALSNKNIARVIKHNGIDPAFFYREQLARTLAASTWHLTGRKPSQQEVDQEVDNTIKMHGHYLPMYQ